MISSEYATGDSRMIAPANPPNGVQTYQRHMKDFLGIKTYSGINAKSQLGSIKMPINKNTPKSLQIASLIWL